MSDESNNKFTFIVQSIGYGETEEQKWLTACCSFCDVMERSWLTDDEKSNVARYLRIKLLKFINNKEDGDSID